MPTPAEIDARKAQRAAERAQARAAAADAIDDRPTPRPRTSHRKRTATVEICRVETCEKAAVTRGLCNRHYMRLARALKAGLSFDLRTGEVVTSPHRPEPPTLTSGMPGCLGDNDMARIKHDVEVDAATVLPFALAFCVAQSLHEMGLADNPEAMAAFASALAPRALPSSTSQSDSDEEDPHHVPTP